MQNFNKNSNSKIYIQINSSFFYDFEFHSKPKNTDD